MIPFIYFSGVIIIFLFMLLLYAWAISSDEVPEDQDIISMMIDLLIIPWFSWLLIILVLLALGIEYLRDKYKDKE